MCEDVFEGGSIHLSETLHDFPCETLIYLTMSRNWLCLSSHWIGINIVLATVANENATGFLDCSHKIAAFHIALISSS